MPSGILTHGCRAEHQTLKRGLILVLSSSVPPVIERISGYRSRVIDTADPQVGQKWRDSRFFPSSRVSYVVSLPSIVTASRGKMTPIKNADPRLTLDQRNQRWRLAAGGRAGSWELLRHQRKVLPPLSNHEQFRAD